MASVFPEYLSSAALSWACFQEYADQRLNGQPDPFYALSLLFVSDCLEAQITYNRDRNASTLTKSAWAKSSFGDFIEPFFDITPCMLHDGWMDVTPKDVSAEHRSMHAMNTPAVMRTITAANEMSPMQWKQMVHALPVCLEAMKCNMMGIDPASEVKQRRYLIALPNETVAWADFKKNPHARAIGANENRGKVIQINFG